MAIGKVLKNHEKMCGVFNEPHPCPRRRRSVGFFHPFHTPHSLLPRTFAPHPHQPTSATTHIIAHALPTHAHHNTNTTAAHPISPTTKHMPTYPLPHAPRQHSHTTYPYPYTPQPVGLHTYTLPYNATSILILWIDDG